MTVYPELMLAMAHDRQREFAAEADRAPLLNTARRWARATHSSIGRSHTPAASAP